MTGITGILENTYKNKTVLVTGHTGFKGSWLSIWLNQLGANVIGYALEPLSNLDNFVLSGIHDRITDIRGDIRDYEKFFKVLEEYKPEFIFHLAAQPIVRLSYECPKETYDVNIGGTVNVLESIRHIDSVKVAIMVTSDKCYENSGNEAGYRENDPMGGFDPYSSSKGAAELVISGYRNSFFNPGETDKHGKSISSVRAGNVIGGGDWAKDRIIPDCIKALMQNNSIEIRNPLSIRPWQHVIEPVYGYLMLGSKMFYEPQKYAGSWNFGPENHSPATVKDIVGEVIKNWGSGNWKDVSNPGELFEAKSLMLDINKAKSSLGWKPVLEIEKAVEMTVDWYKYVLNPSCCHGSIYDFCVKQIDEYLITGSYSI